MELLRGKVNSIRHSIEIGGNKESTTTNHVAVFELEGTVVELKLPESIVVNAGDEVMVAGKYKRGIFNGFAYQNVSKRLMGKGPVTKNILLGTIFALIGLGTFKLVIGAGFLAIGIYMIYQGRLYSRAYSMVTP